MSQTDLLSNGVKLLMGGFIMGWGPCLAYTAPFLLSYIGGTKTSWQGGLKVSLMFSIGKLLALAILGAVATVAFSAINRFFPPHKAGWLYLIIALFMITLGILIVLNKGIRTPFGKIILDRGTGNMFFLGFLMGILPCVPLIAVLTYIACVAENVVLAGILYAVLFGIGAAFAPIILGTLVGSLPEILKSAKLRRGFQTACGIVLILFGSQLVYSVFNMIL